MIPAKDASENAQYLLVDASGFLQVVNSAELPAGTQLIGVVKIGDGTETATVTAEGYLDVKTHSPDFVFNEDYPSAITNELIIEGVPDKKIFVQCIFISTEDDKVNVEIKEETTGKILLKLYTTKACTGSCSTYAGKLEYDKGITLTCGADTFVSIGYELRNG